MEPTPQNLYDAIMNGDATGATSMVNHALSQGLPAPQILNEGMIAAMDHVGKLFEEGEFFVPEMLTQIATQYHVNSEGHKLVSTTRLASR